MNSLTQSVSGILNICALLSLIMLVYSIVGKSIYEGNLYFCENIDSYSGIDSV